MLPELQLHVVNFLQLVEEPGIDGGDLRELLDGVALAQRVTHVAEPLRMWSNEPLRENLGLDLLRPGPLAGIERTHAFEQRLFERAADGHHLANRFHLRPEAFVGARKFLELPLGNLHHHVIQGWLERCRSLARDVVGNFVQRVAHRQLGRDFRNRKAGSLGSQRGGPRYTRVHLDHDHPASLGIHAELDVRAARLHANFANNGDRGIAHRLVLAVSQSLRGRHGNRIAGMHAHGIEILNRADDDDVVLEVAHHLQLIFFPAEHRFFDQRLVHRGEIEAAGEEFHELFAIEGDAATGTAERERGTDDDRKANLAGELQSVLKIVHQRGLGNVESDLLHRVLEEEPVLGFLDGRDVRADELRVVLLEHATVRKLNRQVQSRLPANSGQNSETGAGRKLALEPDDFFQVLARERLDVSAIGNLRVGHDGRRVRVRQHHFVALGLERLTGLGARVIELRRLPDDDGPGAEDQNFRDVIATWHVRSVVGRWSLAIGLWLLVFDHWFFHLWTIDGFALKGRGFSRAVKLR